MAWSYSESAWRRAVVNWGLHDAWMNMRTASSMIPYGGRSGVHCRRLLLLGSSPALSGIVMTRSLPKTAH